MGLWGAIGDFVSGVVLVSMFAFPIVLHNAEVIGSEALTTISLSTLALVGALTVFLSRVTI